MRSELIPGTSIEVVRRRAASPRLRMALLDLDGTLSLIRAGWQTVMADRMVADLLRHACWHGLQLAGQPVRTPGELLADLERLAAIMRENWLARSRPGGLDDSLARLDYLRGIYREQTG